MKLALLLFGIVGVLSAQNSFVFAGESVNYLRSNKEIEKPQLMEEKDYIEMKSRKSFSKGKGDDACIIMGGVCVTNTNDCSESLVTGWCKKQNRHCCVPRTLKNIETQLQSMEQNIEFTKEGLKTGLVTMNKSLDFNNEWLTTDLQAMEGLKTELQSMKRNQNVTNEWLKKVLQSLKKDLNITKEWQSHLLQSMEQNQNVINEGLKVELPPLNEYLNYTIKELKKVLKCMPLNNTKAISNMLIELQTLQANVTDGNSNIDLKIESINSSLLNLNSKLGLMESSISNQDSKLTSIKSAISNQESEISSIKSTLLSQDSKLCSIKSFISNQDPDPNINKSAIPSPHSELSSKKSAISNQDSDLNELKLAIKGLDSDLRSTQSFISDLYSKLQLAIPNQDKDLKFIKSAISTKNSEFSSFNSKFTNIASKLNTIEAAIINQELKLMPTKEAKGCFRVSSKSDQCFRLYMDVKRNWTSARDWCQSAGLRLAEPDDPISLRKYIIDKLGEGQAWVGARGDGYKMVYEKTNQYTLKDNPWLDIGQGISEFMSTSYCLKLDARRSHKHSPYGSPYDAKPCNFVGWTLCEVVEGSVY